MNEDREYPEGLMIKPLDKLGWVVSGFGIKKPHDNAPDFVKANVSISIEKLKSWFILFEKDNISNEWATLAINEPYFQGRIDIQVAQFKSWVTDFVNNNPGDEWINIDIKESQKGKLYAERNTYKSEKKQAAPDPKPEPTKDDDIPW